ncbi:hypothetical protein PR003_g15647 [Phytophthora rubi]|uniref:Uncharacterized protein n=1 Tax=Phytophthora rubi TaxID=129364 RepID=A0A6A3LJ22_9STRA|nr:hypothetical protein PR002_g14241 [Phytophthora rubi]KAE9019382.1 hypothetical protein PR001_g13894 [Phytophthora rubi]KAE9329021.1 hypothetical protein PR003_g15647 [Phytophthora rubi]
MMWVIMGMWGMLRPSGGVAVIRDGFLFLRTTSNAPGLTGPGRQLTCVCFWSDAYRYRT